MKSEAENLINEAIAGLRLRDIVLFESRLFRGNVMPDQDEVEALQQLWVGSLLGNTAECICSSA